MRSELLARHHDQALSPDATPPHRSVPQEPAYSEAFSRALVATRQVAEGRMLQRLQASQSARQAAIEQTLLRMDPFPIEVAEKAVSPLTVDSLESIKDTTCAICLQDLREGEEAYLLKCGHGYHWGCVRPWLIQKRRGATCPTCKAVVVPPAQRDATEHSPGPTSGSEQWGPGARGSRNTGGRYLGGGFWGGGGQGGSGEGGSLRNPSRLTVLLQQRASGGVITGSAEAGRVRTRGDAYRSPSRLTQVLQASLEGGLLGGGGVGGTVGLGAGMRGGSLP